MERNDRSKNLFTGLGVVVFIMLFVIAMPFMMGIASFLFSVIITVAMIGIGLWLIIMLLSAIGGMFNSVKDKKVGEYTKARVKDGTGAWNAGIDKFSTILQRMKAQREDSPKDDPNVIYQGHDDEGSEAQREHADHHYSQQ